MGANTQAVTGGEDGSAPSRGWVLSLFVAGQSGPSRRALENLRRLREHPSLADAEVTIVDVLQQPELAEDQRILATPTLIRVSPAPARRLIGDLSDVAVVVAGLDLPGDFGERMEAERR